MSQQPQQSTGRAELEKALNDAFTQHAIDNNGRLTSPRSGQPIIAEISQLFIQFVADEAGEAEILTLTMQLAEEGLALVTASAMMRALDRTAWAKTADSARLADFQLRFLEKLAHNREFVGQKAQEQSQMALQQALHKQLQQQRRLHQAQEQRNHNLNQVLQLNAHLVPITDEPTLLEKAADGICQALGLADAAIYEFRAADSHWIRRAMTAVDEKSASFNPTQAADLLNGALSGNGEIINRYPAESRKESVAIAIILRLGGGRFGGITINSGSLDNYSYEEIAILIRTFAQNLAALWRNLLLFSETRQRARELEILHGRYVDAIWNSETAVLNASFNDNALNLTRETPALPAVGDGTAVALRVGDHPFGQIKLPANSTLTGANAEFAESLIREMSNALNNAQLLQTARAFSNQLSLAAEVSRAATTILNREQLMQEVVELIQASFDYYYVGLFMVDEDSQTATLRAGTGEAGQQLVAQNFKLPLNGSSMISVAIGGGKAHAEQDVRSAKAFHRNALLPHTRAELALPIRARGLITGALTIQSSKTGVFAQDTITALQALADQFAVAIVNASLFTRVQENLDETNRLYVASRQINAAQTAVAVYQALINFSRSSNLADAAYIVSVDPDAPDYFALPVLWSRARNRYNAQDRFPRDKFPFGEQLISNELILIRNAQTDPSFGRLARRLSRENNLRALALVPIQVDGEWLGTLALQRTEATPFNKTELQPFFTLVDQSAVILSNQQLLNQAETLYQAGQALSQALTRDDALAITVQYVARYTGASHCRFVLYDMQTGQGEIVAENAPTKTSADIPLPTQDDFVFERLKQDRKPLLLAENAAPEDCMARYVRPFGAKSTLLIPATSQQELIGFLALDSQRRQRPFNQANTIFAQTIVDHLTTQLENLNLLEEALSRAQELITLNQIQSGISGILNLAKLAQTVYKQVGRLLDNTIFTLARYQSQTGQYTPILCVREGEATVCTPKIIDAGTPLHKLLSRRKPLVADESHPLMRQTLIPGETAVPQSSLWVPLLQDNQPTGLISLQSYEPGCYTETDVQLLRSIATQTSLAIANAQFFEEIQASNKQLRQLDHLKTQFLANMSHELRTPLNSIIGFSRVILKGIDGPISPAQEEDLTTIYHNGQHLLALINEILDMAKIEAGKMKVSFAQIDLAQAVQMALNTVRSLVDKEKVQLIADIAPDLPQIEADPVRLRQILNNLLSNAAKFTNEGYIRLMVEQEDDNVHIVVSDTGIGIDEKDYDSLFQPFEQLENRDSRIVGGTGLGLPITRWLISTHNGRIWVNSQLGQGASFHVVLPVRQPADSPTEVSLSGSPLAPTTAPAA